jgi:hypothetical protein
MSQSILWCKSHYRLDFCKEKLREIRKEIATAGTRLNQEYKSASLCSYLTEFDYRTNKKESYAKIRLYYK